MLWVHSTPYSNHNHCDLVSYIWVFKDPIIILNRVNITTLELIYGTIPTPGVNILVMADVSIKIPNIVSFKYSNTNTTLYYHAMVVGGTRTA